MAHQTTNANSKPDGSCDDKYLLPSVRFNQRDARKVSEESQVSQNQDTGAQGCRVQIATGTANPNLRSTSDGSQLPVVNHPSAPRSRSNPWTGGFERAMQHVAEAGRPSLPLPIGHGRPTCTGRSVSAATQGTTVTSGNGTARLDTACIQEAVENAVERQIADALAPLRLIASNLTETSQHLNALRQEKADFQEQNDIFGRQLDLQYHEIQQNSNNANAHVRALVGLVETLARNSQNVADNMAHNSQRVAENMVHNNQAVADNMARNNQAVADNMARNSQAVADNMARNSQAVADNMACNSQAAAENLDTINGLVSQLSLIVSHLPVAVGQAVHSETRLALDQVMNAQQQSFDQIKEFFSHQYTQLEHYCIAVTQHLGDLQRQRTCSHGDVGTGTPAAAFQDESKRQNEEQEASYSQGMAYKQLLEVESFESKGECEVVSDRGTGKVCGKVKAFFKKLVKLGCK